MRDKFAEHGNRNDGGPTKSTNPLSTKKSSIKAMRAMKDKVRY